MYPEYADEQEELIQVEQQPVVDDSSIDVVNQPSGAVRRALMEKYGSLQAPGIQDPFEISRAQESADTQKLYASIGRGVNDMIKGSTGFVPSDETYKSMTTSSDKNVSLAGQRQKAIRDYLLQKEALNQKVKKQNSEMKNQFRDEFNKLVGQDAIEANKGILKIRESANAKNRTAADDLALIFAYAKVLDPRSVVKEGEVNTISTSPAIADWVKQAYLKATQGVRLSPKQVAELLNAAEGQYSATVKGLAPAINSYRSRASKEGIDVEDIVGDYSVPTGKRKEVVGGDISDDQLLSEIERVQRERKSQAKPR